MFALCVWTQMAVKTAKNELLSSGKLDLDGIELASPMLCQRSRVRFPPQFISLPRVNTLRAGGCQLGGGGGCPDCPTAFHVRTTFVIFPKLEGGGGGEGLRYGSRVETCTCRNNENRGKRRVV